MEKEIRGMVQESLTKAKAGSFPPADWLYKEIYATKDGKDEPQKFIRFPDFAKSVVQA